MKTNIEMINMTTAAIDTWLDDPANIERWITTAELFKELKKCAERVNLPSKIADSPRSLGIRINHDFDHFQALFGMKKRVSRGFTQYLFLHKKVS